MNSKKLITSLGIMTGTSLDGIDISIIKSDGNNSINLLHNITYKYPKNLKNEIKKLIVYVNKNNIKNYVNNSDYLILEKKFNNLIKKKIILFLKKINFKINEIDIIGFHGQTIIHNPKMGLSVQLGCGDFLSKFFKIPTVTKFRKKDILRGGHGAPLVPIFHKAIFGKKNKSICVVNIGGISNVTYIKNNSKIIASDVGPGNKLMDEFCNLEFNLPYDSKGKIASDGNVSKKLINIWKKKSFIKIPFPKSFDNYFFQIKDYYKKIKTKKKDFLSSLTYFTAYIIKDCQRFFPTTIDLWIFCGGGVKNLYLKKVLKKKLKRICTADEIGYDSEFIESQAFAYIAIRTLKKLPSSFPSTTGVKKKTVCGEIYKNF